LAKTAWGRSGGRSADNEKTPFGTMGGRFRKRPPLVLGVVWGVIEIGSIEEAAARFSFYYHINGAKIYQAVEYGGLF
jgi:hypothetical protein